MGLPEFPVGRVRLHPRHQNARVLADSFFRCIAGKLSEFGIDIFNLTLEVGDNRARWALLNRKGQFPDSLLRSLRSVMSRVSMQTDS
jgi:hypothetical protein